VEKALSYFAIHVVILLTEYSVIVVALKLVAALFVNIGVLLAATFVFEIIW